MGRDEARRALAKVVTAGMLVVAFILGVISTLIALELDDDRQQRQSRDPDRLQVTGGQVPACDELPGMPTQEVVNDTGACTRGSEMMLLGSFSEQCPDGKTLSWNDFGWGYQDGDWQAHQRADGQLVPPAADLDGCRSGG